MVLGPLLSFRHLQQPLAATVLGVAAMCLWAGATLYLAAELALRGKAHPLHPWPAPQLHRLPWQRAALEMAAVPPVVLTAFMCQVPFFPIVRELELPATPPRMRRAAGAAFAAILAVILALAAGSQAVFGDGIGPNVLSSFQVAQIRKLLPHRLRTAAAPLVVRLAYSLALLAAFPLQVQQLRESLSSLRHPRASPRQQHQEATEPQGWRPHALMYALLAAVCALATALPSVWTPLLLVGATAGTTVAFILPGTLAFSLAGWRLGSRGGVGGLLLVLLGSGLMIAGVISLVLA